jgi:triacylglycerol lipase
MGLSTSGLRSGCITICGLFQLFFAGSARADSTAAPARPASGIGAGRRVLLVHGIYNSAKSMQWVRRLLEARGWRVYAISLKPSDASIPFDAMAAQLDAFVNTHIPPGEKFDLVAFSMGGLVSRYYIQKLGGYKRVRRFVTISAPNHGSILAWFRGEVGVKQMRPGSEMLRDLNGDMSKLVPLDYTSIYTPFDLSIIPPVSSRMPIGRNVLVWVPLHPFMLMMRAPLREIERALE